MKCQKCEEIICDEESDCGVCVTCSIAANIIDDVKTQMEEATVQEEEEGCPMEL